jgi:AcrR family transcriptional regulator
MYSGRRPRPVKRPYDNRTRELQSDATRDRILEAARTLLVEHGYRTTTIAAIARAADVHADTIYALVGRKPAVLQALIERAISGGAGAVAPQDRDYVRAMKAEPDPRAKLAIYARAITRIQTRLAPLLLALRDAAATESEARQVWDEINDRRAGNMRSLVRDLGPEGTLRRGVSVDEAADVIWLTASAETFIQLTVERGWSVGAYERWLVAAWPRLLLADG